MIRLKPSRRTTSRRVQVADRRRRHQEGLKFARVFSQKAIAPFDEIEWEHRTAEITDDSGKTIFKQDNVEVPTSWSALATKIAVSKYFYGDIANGTDPYKGGRERSVKQLVHRVTRDQGWLFRRQGKRGDFLQRADVAVCEPIWRVQFAGVVQCRPVAPIPGG
jgi:ribonucleoside-diphosphate reductase alpha chain